MLVPNLGHQYGKLCRVGAGAVGRLATLQVRVMIVLFRKLAVQLQCSDYEIDFEVKHTSAAVKLHAINASSCYYDYFLGTVPYVT